ncbi:MAG: hypothetical protein A3H36_08420 [Chloroflexi bacterium RIFCSPLOWO2_02_FULL_71_16]|nr:MAG: hypothetical protein A3H36_08420 [Chloroflexi bacterium RIFCSPLOWO2_02_FULL_71_16]
MSPVAAGDLRRVAGRFPTGVTVVTATAAGRPCGLTVSSFTSVSLEPPLVLVCIARTARAYACFEAAQKFAVNVLADDQEAVARLFASLSEDKFRGLAYRPSPAGHPLLEGVHAWLDCETAARYEAGTHTVYLARVTDLGAGSGRPLLFYRSAYARLGGVAPR